MKKIFVVDVMAMAFRSFHAFSRRPLSTSKGFPTSALFGSAMFLLKLIEDERPDYFVLACDSEGKNFRHDLYSEYKAQRKEMPKDLSLQIPEFMRMFELWGLPLIKIKGFEADDIIGSIAAQWAAPNVHCYIVSGDKDFLQLVNANTFLYAPKKGGLHELLDTVAVRERFGCDARHITDFLALWGDSADNIPGVSGIGEKGAASLIKAYGSLEGIYANLDQIANKRLRDSLEASKDQAFLSRKLATIATQVPLPYGLEEVVCDHRALQTSSQFLRFCEEMEFHGLAQKIRLAQTNGPKEDAEGLEAPLQLRSAKKQALYVVKELLPEKEETEQEIQEVRTPQKKAFEAHLVTDEHCLASFLKDCAQWDRFSFDTETTGLNIVLDRPIGLSVGLPAKEGVAHKTYYIPLVPEHGQELELNALLARLKPLFEDESKLKIAHNLKFDLQLLANIGLYPKGPFGDSMLLAFVLDSSRRSYGIDALSLQHLDLEKIPTAALIGKKGEKTMLSVPIKELTEYACEDAYCCLALYELLSPKLVPSLRKVYESIDLPLVPILGSMEQAGILLDVLSLERISKTLLEESQRLIAEIYELAGEEFNINSPKQLQEILYTKLNIPEKLGIRRIKKTKSGFSTDVSVLENLSGHPLPEKILAYRTVSKLKSTYVDSLPLLLNEKTKRLHSSFHQTGAATGRLSSSNPNMQNIPIRSEKGKEIRAAFIAPPGWVLVSADYSQIELRLLAHLADDKALQAAFAGGQDIHKATAAAMFKKPLEEVSSLDRSRAKAINYGIVYGMGAQKLAQSTGSSLKEAKAFIESYFASFPGIPGFIEGAIAFAKEHGYSETIFGRRRLISGLDGSLGELAKVGARNIAVNSPIQGSAADLLKIAMIKIQQELAKRKLQASLLLQVHDELVFECPKGELEELSALVKSGMEEAASLRVALKVELGFGANWLEAH